jgi:urea transporter
MLWKIRKYTQAVVNSYSETVFLDGLIPGMALLLCTFINPNVGVAGLICVVAAYLFSKVMGMDRDLLRSGFCTYNPLLVGLSLGYLFKVNVLTVFFLVSAGILTLVMTVTLSNIFRRSFLLPVLSVPFVIVSSLCYLASRSYANLFVNGIYNHSGSVFLEGTLPAWLDGLARSVGAIFFTPSVLAGVIFLVVLLAWSRILFFLAVTGYLAGTAMTAALMGSWGQAFGDLYAFNFVLINLALGGVFLIPGPRSYTAAILAVVVSPFLMEASRIFWSQYGIPVFTLPFNVVTLCFIYFLRLIGFPLMTTTFHGTPEENLDQFLSRRERYPGTLRGIALPFAGEWTVWQGEDGPWTHKGSWRHAFDFVITDGSGKTFRDDGSKLEHYHAFGKPVLSPVSGRVVRVVDGVEDNRPGGSSRENNWGNAVIVHDARGFHVVVAHLARGSIGCREGEWVEKGQLIGKCGNSGYSPQPHLHVHVQLSPELGAGTVPFSFVHFRESGTEGARYSANQAPSEGNRVVPLQRSSDLDRRVTFLLDEEMTFSVSDHGRERIESVRVRMAPDGTFYFDTGRARLYFDKRDGTYYHYHVEGERSILLRTLLLALPRLPLAREGALEWHDRLPLGTVRRGPVRAALLFLSSFHHGLVKVTGRYRFEDRDRITGTVECSGAGVKLATTLELDDEKGFARASVEGGKTNLSIRRIS